MRLKYNSVIKIVGRSQLVITMPPKKTMKAMKATMAPKAMKTMMKAPKSMKTMKEATAKGKSKKATDVDYRASVQDNYELLTKSLERSDQYAFNAKNARVTFFYGREPYTKTPDELKMIAATLLGPLQMAASASNARRVWAHHCKV